jgi:hypothetical protein
MAGMKSIREARNTSSNEAALMTANRQGRSFNTGSLKGFADLPTPWLSSWWPDGDRLGQGVEALMAVHQHARPVSRHGAPHPVEVSRGLGDPQ